MVSDSERMTNANRPKTIRRGRWLLVLWLMTVAGVSCQLQEAVPFSDQKIALLEVTPLGTPREEVAKRLQQAGIKFDPSRGPEPGVFYLKTWEMETGERTQQYHLFSELLFGPEGKLEEIRETPNNF